MARDTEAPRARLKRRRRCLASKGEGEGGGVVGKKKGERLLLLFIGVEARASKWRRSSSTSVSAAGHTAVDAGARGAASLVGRGLGWTAGREKNGERKRDSAQEKKMICHI